MAKDVNNMSSNEIDWDNIDIWKDNPFAMELLKKLKETEVKAVVKQDITQNRLCALEATVVKLADCIDGLDKHYNEILRKIVGYNRLKLDCAVCKVVHVLGEECPNAENEQITDSVTQ